MRLVKINRGWLLVNSGGDVIAKIFRIYDLEQFQQALAIKEIAPLVDDSGAS